MPAPAYPMVNAIRFSFASVEFNIAGQIFQGFSEISYSQNLEMGEVRGTSPQLLGMTLGDLKAEGSFGAYEEEDALLISALGVGFLAVNFPITVSYASPGQGVITDTIVGARLKGGAKTLQKGTDGIVVKRDFLAFYILENGVAPIPGLRP